MCDLNARVNTSSVGFLTNLRGTAPLLRDHSSCRRSHLPVLVLLILSCNQVGSMCWFHSFTPRLTDALRLCLLWAGLRLGVDFSAYETCSSFDFVFFSPCRFFSRSSLIHTRGVLDPRNCFVRFFVLQPRRSLRDARPPLAFDADTIYHLVPMYM